MSDSGEYTAAGEPLERDPLLELVSSLIFVRLPMVLIFLTD